MNYRMKVEKAPVQFVAGRLLCSIFGHKYRVSNIVTAHIKEYQCTRCAEEITDTANGSLTKLTSQFKETNAKLAHFYERRSRKFSQA